MATTAPTRARKWRCRAVLGPSPTACGKRLRFAAVELKYIAALHRLDQQFAERPHQGINAVRRIPRCGPVDIRCKTGHLVFELREGADVMGAALLVERHHRFGPHYLAARRAPR